MELFIDIEIWKDIEGYEGNYQVSNLGRIKSLMRGGRVLKPSISSGGYERVILSKNGVKKGKLISRLTLESFVPNYDNKPYCNHKDGNKLNNNANNLEWCTAKENIHHAINNKLMDWTKAKNGERHGMAKLTEN